MHTHSLPFHSCVRASSECRSDDHPGRKVSPVLWIPPSASPSVSRTASHSCIAPLQRKTQTQTLGSVEHYIKTQREQVSGSACLFSGRSKAECHSVAQLAGQTAADVGQSPNCNRDATVWTHRAAFLFPTDLLLKATERRKKETDLIERHRADVCLSALSFTEGLWAVQEEIYTSSWGRWRLGYNNASKCITRDIFLIFHF